VDVHQKKLIEAAGPLGIQTQDLSATHGMDLVVYRRGAKAIRIIDGRVYPGLSHLASRIADNKSAGKCLLEEIGIPTPPSLRLESTRLAAQKSALGEFIAKHGTVVCKPVVGTNGVGVAMGLREPDAVLAHIHATGPGAYLVEVEAGGRDLRLQAVGGRLVAACIRQPTTLVGDGKATVRQLIDARNSEIIGLNPDNRVVVDEQVTSLLAEHGYVLDSVIPPGQAVRIKKVANMAQGARALDVTDEVHGDFVAAVERIARALDIAIFSLDFMARDHRRPIADGAYALELNARPAWLHHTFSDGRRHDMPTLILKDLFGIG